MAKFQGNLSATGLKAALVVSRFYPAITESLLEGALDAFLRHGGDPADIDEIWVPGAFEMPLAARRLAQSGRYGAIVALGAVIRGETPHFDYVAAAASNGLSNVATEFGIPVGFGLLTTDTMEQAADRAGSKAGNKGCDAMETAIIMANLFKILP